MCQAVEAGDIKLTSLKQDGCGLNWELETDNDKVVFIVSQTSAMREGLTTQIITVLVVNASAVVLRGIEAECEVSGVTRILLKVHHMLPQSVQPLTSLHQTQPQSCSSPSEVTLFSHDSRVSMLSSQSQLSN